MNPHPEFPITARESSGQFVEAFALRLQFRADQNNWHTIMYWYRYIN